MKDRKKRYDELLEDVARADLVGDEREPYRWLIVTHELVGGQTCETRVSTWDTRTAALGALEDEVRLGFDPDPEAAIVDLDTGRKFSVLVEVICRLGEEQS
jgi:hypothetical protein